MKIMKHLAISIALAINICFTGVSIAKNYTSEEFEELQAKAKQGDPAAQIDIGLLYYSGDGVAENKSIAAKWFIKAAEQGNAVAQHYAGWVYAHGEGLLVNKKKALYWYLKSAENGHIDSQNNVANFYLRGDGVEKNYQKAKYWYEKAVEQGSDYAQYELAVMYLLGEGVDKNKQKAKDLLIQSAAQGNKNAKQALVAMELEDNAEKFSKQRMSDAYFIASLLEEFKQISGHYPFYTENEPVEEGYKKVGTLVTIGTSSAEEQLSKKPNPFHISSAKAYSSHLKRELEQKLERKIELPTDPQEIPFYAPNAYYVYFPAEDDEYLVMAFLYNPNAFTSELFNAHANVYAIASSPVMGEYKFWSSAEIKPRIFSDIKP